MTDHLIKIDGKWYIDLDLYDEKQKELIKDNKQLQEKRKYDECFIYHLKKDKKDLQQRIDKAIEEINYMITNADITEISAIKLKQILGGINENN